MFFSVVTAAAVVKHVAVWIESPPQPVPVSEIKGRAIYSVPPQQIWAVIQPTKALENFGTYLKKFEVLEEKGAFKKIRVEIEGPGPLPTFWNILNVNTNLQTQTIKWERVDGNLKTNEGTVKIPTGTESPFTELHVETKVQAGAILPQGLLEWGVKKFISRGLYALGEKIEKTAAAASPKPVL